MKKLRYPTQHGRARHEYEKGETPSRYGVARQRADGVYEFVNDYGNFHTDYGHAWQYPPDHYLIKCGKHRCPGAFIVNFNKPGSPRPAIKIN
jgi:hypothetical protein